MSDLSQQIEDDAAQPKRVQGDAGSVEKHPLTEVIAADQYLASQDGVDRAHKGLRFSKWRPPGTR
jgi:hypothetical protein